MTIERSEARSAGAVRPTEGYWQAEDSSPLYITANHYPPSERPPSIVATIYIGQKPAGEVRANAALIAEAKNLAEACETLLSIYDEAMRGGDGEGSIGIAPDWYDENAVVYLVSEARATLRKAKLEEAA